MIPIAAVGSIANGLFGIIDRIFPSEADRTAAKIKILELEKSGELAQLAVNAKEAEHASIFVAGWRPFIGWVCGIAFGWTFILYPLVHFLVVILGVPFDVRDLPVLDLSDMMPVLLGMLGLGAMRSYEKVSGVERNNLKSSPPTTQVVDRRATVRQPR